MSMMGMKGIDYLEEVWDMSIEIGCECRDDENFSQDVLGSISCDFCKKEIISQYQVDILEARGFIKSKPKMVKGVFSK